MLRVARSQSLKALFDVSLTIIDLIFLIEAGYIFHWAHLEENQTCWEDITFVYAMRSVASVSVTFYMSFPKSRTQVLRSTSDCCHGADTTIVSVLKVVLGFTKINNFHFKWSRMKEHVGWLNVPVTNTYWLKVGESTDNGDNDLLHFILLPEKVLLLAFAEQVFKVSPTVHVLAHHSNSVSVIHCFIKVIPVELKYVRVTLHLAELYCFFLYELVLK